MEIRRPIRVFAVAGLISWGAISPAADDSVAPQSHDLSLDGAPASNPVSPTKRAAFANTEEDC